MGKERERECVERVGLERDRVVEGDRVGKERGKSSTGRETEMGEKWIERAGRERDREYGVKGICNMHVIVQ